MDTYIHTYIHNIRAYIDRNDICMYAHILFMYVRAYIMYVGLYMYVCMYPCMAVCMYVHLYIIYIYTYALI